MCENEGKWVKKGGGAIGQNNTLKKGCPIGLFSAFLRFFWQKYFNKLMGQSKRISFIFIIKK